MRLKGALLVGLAAVIAGTGASIASATQPDGELVEYSINSDGTGRTQISDFGPQVDQRMSRTPFDFFSLWRSPNGLLFSIGDLWVGSPGIDNPSRTMGLTQVLPSGPPLMSSGPFSPDGTWIAFTAGKCYSQETCSSDCQKDCFASYVYVVKSDGTGLHQVAASGTDASWSADGKWLTYQGFAGNAADGHDTGIYVVRRDGKHGRRLVVDGTEPLFAPRDNLIAYRCERNTSMCVVNRDGSGKRVIGTGYSHISYLNDIWSPDAAKLAVVVPERNQVEPTYYGHLVVLFVNGGKPLTVVRAARIEAPLAWSPDGLRIAYRAQTLSQDIDTDEGVYVASTKTHRSTFITDDPISESDVEWSSNSELTYLTFVH